MSKHSTFSIEREYAAPVERVFAYFSNPELKRRWFGNLTSENHNLDFRVGGREFSQSLCGGDTVLHVFNGEYHVIVPNERIIYSYTLDKGDTRMSISLTTIEFSPDGSGTKLSFTEQGVFLDDEGWIDGREGGTGQGLDALARELEKETARA